MREFEADGVLISGVAGVYSGDGDPATSLFQANIGSIFLSSNGSIYKKIGGLPNQWSQIESSYIPQDEVVSDDSVVIDDSGVVKVDGS